MTRCRPWNLTNLTIDLRKLNVQSSAPCGIEALVMYIHNGLGRRSAKGNTGQRVCRMALQPLVKAAVSLLGIIVMEDCRIHHDSNYLLYLAMIDICDCC
jgi:hypothetical protein